jgi:segregation and condensation protein B
MDQPTLNNLTLPSQLEAVLFYLAEPISLKELAKILQVEESDIKLAGTQLKTELENRGLSLMEVNDSYLLTTAVAASPLIERLIKEELNRDLGKASLETLSIILYEGPLPRSRIDYIRGVNSGYILRHLLTRGLIQKGLSGGERSTTYEATPELLAHLGLSSLSDLPDRDLIKAKISQFEEPAAPSTTPPASTNNPSPETESPIEQVDPDSTV